MAELAARKPPAKAKPGESAEETAKRTAPRASTTDPEARVMKQGDGGWRPGYNINYATDCASRVIVGVVVTNVGSDHGLLGPMAAQLEARYQQLPQAWLADNGFEKHADLERLERSGVAVYLPPQKPRRGGADPYAARPGESAELAAWRERMGQEEAKVIYRERASTAECINAQARNRGLRQLPVRGAPKVRRLAVWYAVTHNLCRAIALGVSWQRRRRQEEREAEASREARGGGVGPAVTGPRATSQAVLGRGTAWGGGWQAKDSRALSSYVPRLLSRDCVPRLPGGGGPSSRALARGI